jgi:anaerobic sulfatase-maturating enzyme
MAPLTMLIKPASGLCDMRCAYCFYADVGKSREVRSYGIMDGTTLENLVIRAFEYSGKSPITFAFQGGEPTLAGLDFYRNLIDYQKRNNTLGAQISNSIQTNGLSIDAEWAEFLAINKFLVGLSLDGTKAIHDANRIDAAGRGTYSRVKKAASLLEAAGAEFNILCVVTSALARHGTQVFDTLVGDGYKYLQFIQCLDGFDCSPSPYSLTSERWGDFLCSVFDRYYSAIIRGDYISVRPFDNFMELAAGLPPSCCGYNGVCECYFVVESDGGVYPCDFYVLDRYRMGNIRDSSFADLCRSEAATRFVAESEPVDGDCQACEWYNLCRGGCRRHRETPSGGILAKNRFCEGNKRFFTYALPRMRELLRYIKK